MSKDYIISQLREAYANGIISPHEIVSIGLDIQSEESKKLAERVDRMIKSYNEKEINVSYYEVNIVKKWLIEQERYEDLIDFEKESKVNMKLIQEYRSKQ